MRTSRRCRIFFQVIAWHLAGLFMLGIVGCSHVVPQGSSSHTVIVAGSTTVLPIAEIAAERFKARVGANVLVSGLGSSAGIEAVIQGTADIASSSRNLTAEEKKHNLCETVVAHDGIAVIVNESNGIPGLDMEQLRAIYAGRITNWREVGGPDLAIQVINRDEASGTREAFKKIVMGTTPFDRRAAVLPGTGQVRDVVGRTPGAIGYISIGFVASENAAVRVKSLAIDGVMPSEETVEHATYPISRELYFFTKGEATSLSRDYITYVISDEMISIVRDAGYIPVRASRG